MSKKASYTPLFALPVETYVPVVIPSLHSRNIRWTCKDGTQIYIEDMKDRHLLYSHRLLIRKLRSILTPVWPIPSHIWEPACVATRSMSYIKERHKISKGRGGKHIKALERYIAGLMPDVTGIDHIVPYLWLVTALYDTILVRALTPLDPDNEDKLPDSAFERKTERFEGKTGAGKINVVLPTDFLDDRY